MRSAIDRSSVGDVWRHASFFLNLQQSLIFVIFVTKYDFIAWGFGKYSVMIAVEAKED